MTTKPEPWNLTNQLKVTDWLRANKKILVEKRLNRQEAADLCTEQLDLKCRIGQNHINACVKALGWTDWPRTYSKSAGGSDETENLKDRVDALEKAVGELLLLLASVDKADSLDYSFNQHVRRLFDEFLRSE